MYQQWFRYLILIICLPLFLRIVQVRTEIRDTFSVTVLSITLGLLFARIYLSDDFRFLRRRIRGWLGNYRYPYTSIVVVLWALLWSLAPTLWRGHLPDPFITDEFAYVLSADTFAQGRLTNPTPAGWEHFESFHISLVPSYYSKYQPGAGLILALGQILFGHPYYGCLLAILFAAVSMDWMFSIWLPKRWALFASLLSVLLVAANWGDSYLASAPLDVAAGAILLACLRQINVMGIRWFHGMLIAASVVIFLFTRPLEGGFFTLFSGAVFVYQLNHRQALFSALFKLVGPALLILIPAIWFHLCWNQACVGSYWKLPYLEHDRQYAKTPFFVFQPPADPSIIYRHRPMRDAFITDKKWHMDQKQWQILLYEAIPFKFGAIWLNYLYFLSLFPLITIPELFRQRWCRIAMFCCLPMLLLIPMVTWCLPHYVAPAWPAWAYLVIMALRHVRTIRLRQLALGRWLVSGAMIGFFLFLVLGKYQSLQLMTSSWTEDRRKIIQELDNLSGKHLVFIEYGPEHDPLFEWTYNEANINKAHILWVRSMGKEKDQALVSEYPDRTVWLLRVDFDPGRTRLIRKEVLANINQQAMPGSRQESLMHFLHMVDRK